MINFSKIKHLLEKEWMEFRSSKAWIVVIVLPLFIAFIFNVIYHNEETVNFKIGYATALKPELKMILTESKFRLIRYPSAAGARASLANGTIDGFIIPSPQSDGNASLQVNQSNISKAAVALNAINATLVRLYSGRAIPQIALKYSGPKLSNRWLAFPVWIIQIILAVCLLQAAASIADEKEKQTFHSLLISAMTLGDYLAAKIIWNGLVGLGAIWFAVLLTGCPLNGWSVSLIGLLGGFVYTALALIIGLFSPNPLFARTIATLTYLISAVPIMVRDLSFSGKALLNIFPSFLMMGQLENALIVHSPRFEGVIATAAGLLAECLILFFLAHAVITKKADF